MELPLQIADLPEETRTWLEAKAAETGKSLLEIIREELETAARAQGFGDPKKIA